LATSLTDRYARASRPADCFPTRLAHHCPAGVSMSVGWSPESRATGRCDVSRTTLVRRRRCVPPTRGRRAGRSPCDRRGWQISAAGAPARRQFPGQRPRRVSARRVRPSRSHWPGAGPRRDHDLAADARLGDPPAPEPRERADHQRHEAEDDELLDTRKHHSLLPIFFPPPAGNNRIANGAWLKPAEMTAHPARHRSRSAAAARAQPDCGRPLDVRSYRKKSLAVIEARVVLVSLICMSAARLPPVLTWTITSAPAMSLMRTWPAAVKPRL